MVYSAGVPTSVLPGAGHFESRADDEMWPLADGSLPPTTKANSLPRTDELDDLTSIGHNELSFENFPPPPEAAFESGIADHLVDEVFAPCGLGGSPGLGPADHDQQYLDEGTLLELTVRSCFCGGADDGGHTASTETPSPSPGRKKRTVSEPDESLDCDSGEAFVRSHRLTNCTCSVSRRDDDASEPPQQRQCWGDARRVGRGPESPPYFPEGCVGHNTSARFGDNGAGQPEIPRTGTIQAAGGVTRRQGRQTAKQRKKVAGRKRAKTARVPAPVLVPGIYNEASSGEKYTEYNVEDVLDARRSVKSESLWEYRVKWQGYSRKTWVTEKDFPVNSAFKDKMERLREKVLSGQPETPEHRRTGTSQAASSVTSRQVRQPTARERRKVAGRERTEEPVIIVVVPGIYKDTGDEEEYPIEDVLDAKLSKKHGWEYSVKWQGSEASWVIERNIPINSAFNDKMKRLREQHLARLASKKRAGAPELASSPSGDDGVSSGSRERKVEEACQADSRVRSSSPRDSGGCWEATEKKEKIFPLCPAPKAEGLLLNGQTTSWSKGIKEESSANGVARHSCQLKTCSVSLDLEASRSGMRAEQLLGERWSSPRHRTEQKDREAFDSSVVSDFLPASFDGGLSGPTVARAVGTNSNNVAVRTGFASSDDTSSDSSDDSSVSTVTSENSDSDDDNPVDKQSLNASRETSTHPSCFERERTGDLAETSLDMVKPRVAERFLHRSLPEGRSRAKVGEEADYPTQDRSPAGSVPDQGQTLFFGVGRGKGVFLRRPPEQNCHYQADQGSVPVAGLPGEHLVTEVSRRSSNACPKVTTRATERQAFSLSGSEVSGKLKYLADLKWDTEEGESSEGTRTPGLAAPSEVGVARVAATELGKCEVPQSEAATLTGDGVLAASPESAGTKGRPNKPTGHRERFQDNRSSLVNEVAGTSSAEPHEVVCVLGKRRPANATGEALSRADTAADMDDVTGGAEVLPKLRTATS